MRNLISVLVAPPAGPLILAALGWWLARRRRWLGRALVVFGLAGLVLASLPVVASALLLTLEAQHPAIDAEALAERLRAGAQDAPQAIVVLASGLRQNAPEVPEGETVNARTIERLAYGARLARATGLPLLLSGGATGPLEMPEAELMKLLLRRSFGLDARWVEPRSLNTAENAQASARLLQAAGMRRAVLVTHAYHMPRAAAAFRAAGLDILPAPTAFGGGWVHDETGGWIPHASAMQSTRLAVHEWAGMLWYRYSGQSR